MLGTRWPRLARKIGLSTKVDSIRDDYRGDTHEQAVVMLTKWKEKHGSNAKIRLVIKALRELDRNDIADYILGACRGKENSTNNYYIIQFKMPAWALTLLANLRRRIWAQDGLSCIHIYIYCSFET